MNYRKFFLWTFLCLLFVVALSAQTTQTTGSIRGVIKDNEGNALPGVNVTVTGPALLGSESAVTNESGAYRISFLPAGTYSIIAELQGFQIVRREGVIVRVGMTVTINFVMPPETLEKEVTVVAPSPPVDVVSTKTVVAVPEESLANIPIARDVNNILNLAPGTTNLSIKGGLEITMLSIWTVSMTMPLTRTTGKSISAGTPSMKLRLSLVGRVLRHSKASEE